MLTLPATPPAFDAAAAKADLAELDARIRQTDQIIARMTELLHRRKIHRANLVLAKGKLATALTVDLLDHGRDYDQAIPVATSRPIRFTPDERDHFTAREARRLAEEDKVTRGQGDKVMTLDTSTSQLPADFIDRDHDGHG